MGQTNNIVTVVVTEETVRVVQDFGFRAAQDVDTLIVPATFQLEFWAGQDILEVRQHTLETTAI